MVGLPALLLAMPLLSGAVSAAAEGCSCAAIMETDGWCKEHALGYIAGLEIHTEVLFEVLDAHGHEVDLASFECPG